MAIQIKYLGWSTFQFITTKGTKIVIDPFLVGDAKRGIPPAVASVRDLTDTDVLMVTHAAEDHAAQALELMKESRATLICPKDVSMKIQKGGIPLERMLYMVPGIRFDIADIRVKGLEASHISLAEFEGHWLTGVPLSYIIDFGPEGKIFFGGDSALGAHYRIFGEVYQPDLAILGIGGVLQRGQYNTELYPDEAAIATKWLNVQAVIPMHYQGDEAAEFKRELEKQAPRVKLVVMKPGEKISFSRAKGVVAQG